MNLPYIQSELFRELVGLETLLKPGYALNITRNCFKELHANLWKICRDGDGDIGAHSIQNLCVRQINTVDQITAEINRIWNEIPAECKRDIPESGQQETPRPTEKCGTCALLEPFHEFNGVMYSTCPHAKPENHGLTSPLWVACPHYTPVNH